MLKEKETETPPPGVRTPPPGVDIAALADELQDGTAEDVIRWAIETYGPRIAVSTSFQVEGMVILDMAYKVSPDVRVLTVDTGRLPKETHDMMAKVRERYGVPIEVHYPDANELAEIVTKHGSNAFYRSVSLRLLCCNIRKVNPIDKALGSLDAWISGLRRSQGETRARTMKIEQDAAHRGIVKVNPLADWTYEEVWDYTRRHDLPYNELYDKGYTSIGCAPCTRPIEPGEDTRAGRWWWEEGMPKECGIHLGPAWGRTS